MARSIRNSKSLAAKSVKRKGFFTDVVNARDQRIAKKLDEDLKRQKVEESLKKEDAVGGDDNMEVDTEEQKKKVSTSGWRTSRHVTYKKNKIKKKKRRTALVFKK